MGALACVLFLYPPSPFRLSSSPYGLRQTLLTKVLILILQLLRHIMHRGLRDRIWPERRAVLRPQGDAAALRADDDELARRGGLHEGVGGLEEDEGADDVDLGGR